VLNNFSIYLSSSYSKFANNFSLIARYSQEARISRFFFILNFLRRYELSTDITVSCSISFANFNGDAVETTTVAAPEIGSFYAA